MLCIVVPVSTGSAPWILSTPKQKQDKNGTCTTIFGNGMYNLTCIQYVSKQSEDDLSRQKGGQRVKSDWKEWSEGPSDFVYQKEKNHHLLNELWVIFFLGLEKEGAYNGVQILKDITEPSHLSSTAELSKLAFSHIHFPTEASPNLLDHVQVAAQKLYTYINFI